MQMKLLSISFVIVTLPFCIEEDDMQAKPHITVHYCTPCNWLLRSVWMAQALLSTVSDDPDSVMLIPGTGCI